MRVLHWCPFFPGSKRKKLFNAILGVVCFVLFLHLVLDFEGDSLPKETAFKNIHINVPDGFVPKRITEREKFPSGGEPKIPKIIHQTWKTKNIPDEYTTWIKSWMQLHPDWEYWFWTDESADQLVAEKYPGFLETFRGYSEPIRRADAIRYIILYEFGGVYADLDMEALTSINPLTQKYSCFIGQEPYEHPVLDGNFEQLLINAIMGCKKGHPFMKKLIDSLPKYSIFWHVLDSTGPHFVTHVYRQYVSDSEHATEIEYDSFIYITPSEYFYPTIDPKKIDMFVLKCNTAEYLTDIQKRACQNLKFKYSPQNLFDATKIAFTHHHWSYTYGVDLVFATKTYRPIQEIVPNVKT